MYSESSSCIDGTITRLPHSPAHHNHTHTVDKTQKPNRSTTQHRMPIPMASLPHSTYPLTSPNTGHVPASLAYELSTRKILKPEPVRPRKRVSSFSRELSKRPLEVLRRRSGQLCIRQQELLEKIHVPKIATNTDGETEEKFIHVRESEWSALKQSAKRHSYQMHLPTAEIEPPTDLPAAGVHPCYQPSSADPTLGNPPTHHQHTVETRPSQVRFQRPPTSAVHMDDEENINFVGPPTTSIEDGGGFQPRVPSTILLQLNTDIDEQYESHPLPGFESRRSRHGGHIVHTPRHQLLAPKGKVVVCPFSEESSPNHELEARSLLLKRRGSALQSRERKSRERYHQQSAVSAEHVREHPPPLPSVSPDYMLVGAHFADNNLVLVDRDGKIVHQLTDTEGESDANILAHLSEFNIHTQTSIDQQVLPRMDSLNLEEGQSAVEASKPGTGRKAPPPTALEHSRNNVQGMKVNSEQGLVHVPEVEDGAQTETESGDVVQETGTHPIVYCDENGTKTHIEIRSQDGAQETLLTAKSEAEQEDYRQVKAELKSEDDREQTLHVPIAEHEDEIPENISVDEGATEVADRESDVTSRTNTEMQTRASPQEHSKSKSDDNISGPAGVDTAVDVPVSTTEQQSVGSDCDDSEENRVEGIAPVITHSESSS